MVQITAPSDHLRENKHADGQESSTNTNVYEFKFFLNHYVHQKWDNSK